MTTTTAPPNTHQLSLNRKVHSPLMNRILHQLSHDSRADSDEPPALHIPPQPPSPRALKVLFLSSDTGGGHRASATSLSQRFDQLFPGSVHALCDIVQLDGPPPYNTLVRTYKHLSAHPHQWKLVYNVSNTRAYEMLADVHMKSAMERAVRRRIRRYDPDVVISVHPLMTNVPVLACANISKETGRHLPIFTVCTDLGSAHSMWFANGVEKLFVASEAIRELAIIRGKVPEEKIVMSGLPIRSDFGVQAANMGERHAEGGRTYQKTVRDGLGLKKYRHWKIVLVMGGGEGCGRLSHIVDSLYLQFVEKGMHALILVVCGRNEHLKDTLQKKDWNEMRNRYLVARHKGIDFDSCVGLLSDAGCIGGGDGARLGMAHHLRRIISSPSIIGGLSVSTMEKPFSPMTFSSEHSDACPPSHELALSVPNSRSVSPTCRESSEAVEVVTKSFMARKKAVNSMGGSIGDDKDAEKGDEVGDSIDKAGTPETQPLSSQSSDFDEEIEVIEQSSLVQESTCKYRVKVIGLGFITQMAEYMVAADVLVSKAGPGTIAEAAALSLPVMLTSFLPGQEEGNVDYVIDGGFGSFVSDSDPHGISEEVASWLLDEEKLKLLSENAHKRGAPDAAAEIVQAIGESALRWKKINDSTDKGEE